VCVKDLCTYSHTDGTHYIMDACKHTPRHTYIMHIHKHRLMHMYTKADKFTITHAYVHTQESHMHAYTLPHACMFVHSHPSLSVWCV